METRRVNSRADGPTAGVDVVVPCYNYGHFLRGCVTSVLTQGLEDVRVLIIDNASSDNSAELAQQLAAEDARVQVVARRRNLGLFASWNEGIDWARSAYFMLLCADDFLAPQCFQRALSVLESHPEVGFAYGQAAWLRPHDPEPVLDGDIPSTTWRIVAGDDLIERFCRDGVNHVPGPSAVVVRTAAQKKAGYYCSALPYTADWEMWMRLARLGPAAQTQSRLAILRLHASSNGALAARDYRCARPPAMPWHDEAAFDWFFTHEGGAMPGTARLHLLAKKSVAERAYWAAVAHACRGQLGASWDLFKFAFGRRPATAILPPFSYLLRRQDAADRIIEVASEMLRRPRLLAAQAQVHGSPRTLA